MDNTLSLMTVKQYANIVNTAARCVELASQWADSPNCNVHTDDPCCHRRTGAMIAQAIRREFQLDGEAS